MVVNKKVNIKSKYYGHTRSMCHSLFTTGECFIPNTKKSATIEQVAGRLSHIRFIKNFGRIKQDSTSKQTKQNSVEKLYKRFLYFRYFVALEHPIILCEGKTDKIYLKIAIKQLNKKNKFSFTHKINFIPSGKKCAK